MRVATWNVNSVTARLPRLVEWLELAAPDVLCVQETKVADDAFPSGPVEALGYEVAHLGQGRWNGVGIISRVGLADVQRGFSPCPGFPEETDAAEARALAATCGPLRIWSLYVPNGRTPEDPHYAYKLHWLRCLGDAVAASSAAASPFAIVGDFNVAPTDDDVWDRTVFEGSTHVTPAERDALQRLRDGGLVDVIPRAIKGPHPFTYWDYRAGAFHKGMGMRIDLVYGNAAFADAVTDAYVDRDARKGKGPSDHAPVVVDLDLPL